ncbi:hypothetical protein N0V87_000942 [Didymella glomerata]|jgi:hypothetical protein|uniref:Alpha-L-fucosidase n=1 Tax=Didymella glomerata TaxID=749621 RepID=A0A9W8X779_9PLEO|nr:hypothetical protein N0V87_000942 [Didymella glomerata]
MRDHTLRIATFVATVGIAYATEHALLYTQAALVWNETLPIGNGRLGATPFAKPDQEIIVLNEDSLFSGGFRDRVNPKSLETFPRVRELMDQGNLTGAGDTWLDGMVGIPISQRKYEPAGNLSISTGHNQDNVSNYSRSLDLESGLAKTVYTFGGVRYSREAVASAVDQVLAFYFTADQPNSYNMTIRLDRGSDQVATAVQDGGLWLRGSAKNDSSYTHSQYALVSIDGGSFIPSNTSITIKGASNVTIMWDAESLFYHPEGQASYEKVLRDRVRSATGKGYHGIKKAAVVDHQKYYNRASFTTAAGDSSASAEKATNLRLADLKSVRSFEQDPAMLALAYNYGRYLLIASSRPGTLPANLQGIWNDKFNPPWDSKFTIDINLEMNYWLANMNGLDEILDPIWTHLKRMEARGTAVAKEMYGLPGWVCHHNTDLWGDCAPQDAGTQWTIWPMGGAWMLFTALDHYRFTRDTDFARNIALPLLKTAVQFYDAFSVLQDGYYVTYPSNSPENSYFIPEGNSTAGNQTGIDKSPQSDRTLMWHLYSGFVEISEAVGSNISVENAKQYLARLKAPDISSNTSRLLEWSHDYREVEPEHRHFSSCIGLHPGHQYSPLTNATLAQAAERLIDHRLSSGGGSTGWSRIWASNLKARLLDGDAAVHHANVLMTDYMYDNLWAVTSDVFQADANYGITSAVNEMFLQSQSGVLHIGPAMPTSQLLYGSFRGWKARGNFVVDATWADGQVVSATIVANSGGPLSIRVQDGRTFKVDGFAYSGSISTTAGSSYSVSF